MDRLFYSVTIVSARSKFYLALGVGNGVVVHRVCREARCLAPWGLCCETRLPGGAIYTRQEPGQRHLLASDHNYLVGASFELYLEVT